MELQIFPTSHLIHQGRNVEYHHFPRLFRQRLVSESSTSINNLRKSNTSSVTVLNCYTSAQIGGKLDDLAELVHLDDIVISEVE